MTGYAASSGSGNIDSFASPPPGLLGAFPSGGIDPEQLAITLPHSVICNLNGLTNLLLSVAPANVAGGSPYTEADHVGFCPGPIGTLTVTVKSSFIVVPASCVKPKVATATWTLAQGQNWRFVQRPAPTCAGAYKLKVQLFDPSNTLLTFATVALTVS